MTKVKGLYTLTEPCKACPFRKDVDRYIHAERVVEIGMSLLNEEDFPCHQTTVTVEDEDGETDRAWGSRSRACAGALATLNREGRDTQMQRITARLGIPVVEYSPELPVYDSVAEWVAAKNGWPTETNEAGEVLSWDHCGVVGPNCIDPAGFMSGGGAVPNLEEPTCNPLTDDCSACGALVCEECWGGTRMDGQFEMHLCITCWDDDDEEDEEE